MSIFKELLDPQRRRHSQPKKFGGKPLVWSLDLDLNKYPEGGPPQLVRFAMMNNVYITMLNPYFLDSTRSPSFSLGDSFHHTLSHGFAVPNHPAHLDRGYEDVVV